MFAVLAYFLSRDDFALYGPFHSYEQAEAFADGLRATRPAVGRVDVFQMIPPNPGE